MTGYPPDWDVVDLGLIGTWASGGTPSTSNPAYWNGTIPWISAASMKSFDVRDSERRVTELGANSGTRRVPEGTVVFVVRGMSLKSEFRVGVTCRDVTFGQDCKAIETPIGISARFLAYALKAKDSEILAMVDEAGHGTGRLPTAQLVRLSIGLPDEREQESILSILDSVDESIQSTERLVAKLEQVKWATTEDLLAGGIRAYFEMRRGGMLSEQGGWQLLRCSEVVDERAPVCYGIIQPGAHTNDGVPVIKIKNLDTSHAPEFDHTSPAIDSAYQRSRTQEGDVLLSIKATVGRVMVAPKGFVGNISRDVARLRVRPFVLNEFLCLLLRSEFGQNVLRGAVVGTTRAEISIAALQKIPLPIPSLGEQQRIVQAVSVQEAKAAAVYNELEKMRMTRQGLMNDLLSGRVRVKASVAG